MSAALNTPPPQASAVRRLVLACAVPAVLMLLAVSGVEVWRAVAPSSAETGHRVYGTMGEAVVADDLRGVLGFIERGQSPDALIAVHDPTLTGGDTILVPPIVWAAAAGRQRIVMALLFAGVTFDRDADRAAACIADQLEFPEIATHLRQIGGLPPASTCPAPGPGALLLTVGQPGHDQ